MRYRRSFLITALPSVKGNDALRLPGLLVGLKEVETYRTGRFAHALCRKEFTSEFGLLSLATRVEGKEHRIEEEKDQRPHCPIRRRSHSDWAWLLGELALGLSMDATRCVVGVQRRDAGIDDDAEDPGGTFDAAHAQTVNVEADCAGDSCGAAIDNHIEVGLAVVAQGLLGFRCETGRVDAIERGGRWGLEEQGATRSGGHRTGRGG